MADVNMLPINTWQERLADACQNARWAAPVYNIVSDRRGGRTAWSATVTVNNQNVAARYWYDGQYLNNAKEDAAEVAYTRFFSKPGSSPCAFVEQYCEKQDSDFVNTIVGSDAEGQKIMCCRKQSRGAYMVLMFVLVLIMVATGLGISLHIGTLNLNGLPTWL